MTEQSKRIAAYAGFGAFNLAVWVGVIFGFAALVAAVIG